MGAFRLEKKIRKFWLEQPWNFSVGKGCSISHRKSWHGARYLTEHQDVCRVGIIILDQVWADEKEEMITTSDDEEQKFI